MDASVDAHLATSHAERAAWINAQSSLLVYSIISSVVFCRRKFVSMWTGKSLSSAATLLNNCSFAKSSSISRDISVGLII